MPKAGTSVILRGGARAVITDRLQVGAYSIAGYLESTPSCPELWTDKGHWLEDDQDHPLDIVTLIAPDGKHFRAELALQ